MSHGFPRPLNNSIAVGGADFITLPYGRRSQGTRRKAKVKTFLPLSWGRSSIRAATVRERSASRLLTRAAPRLALSHEPQPSIVSARVPAVRAGQLGQTGAGFGGQCPGQVAPAPVALRPTWEVHAAFAAQTQHVLQGDDRQNGD